MASKNTVQGPERASPSVITTSSIKARCSPSPAERLHPTSEAEEGEEVLRLGLAAGQVLDGGGQRGGAERRQRGGRAGGSGGGGGGGGGDCGGLSGGQPAVQAALVGHLDRRGAGRVGLRLGELPLGLQTRSEGGEREKRR